MVEVMKKMGGSYEKNAEIARKGNKGVLVFDISKNGGMSKLGIENVCGVVKIKVKKREKVEMEIEKLKERYRKEVMERYGKVIEVIRKEGEMKRVVLLEDEREIFSAGEILKDIIEKNEEKNELAA